LFHRRFRAALEKAVQDGTSLYLMLIDLDDFKDVNDMLGYDAGTGFVLTRERETGVRPISDMSLAIMGPVFRASEQTGKFAVKADRLPRPWAVRRGPG
jgi:predicted signal transduction protein with EAL and GGDEF domain